MNDGSSKDGSAKPVVLAISSGGGHWVQLLRLRPAFDGCDVTYATVMVGYRSDLDAGTRFHVIPDGNRWNKWKLLCSALGILWLLLRLRPDVIVTTGAAPGYFALRLGKWLGARVVWIDSIANAGELSMSGAKAGAFADLWLTQWPHLAREGGPQFFGSVL
jgi:UDP-N-acetylglucosamine:LPS N-acetylglucosamine transferase